jgi:hypothetical protein
MAWGNTERRSLGMDYSRVELARAAVVRQQMNEARRRVVAGGLWLDLVRPGWQALIDWDVMDMCTADRCIAGQVFAEEAAGEAYPSGGFWYVADVLMDGNTDQAEAFGLISGYDVSFTALDQAWREVFGPVSAS